jgi:hypothetical protein
VRVGERGVGGGGTTSASGGIHGAGRIGDGVPESTGLLHFKRRSCQKQTDQKNL